jgi:hypothetical protein
MGYSSLKAALDQLKSPVISAAKGKMGSDIPESVCETSGACLQLIHQTVCCHAFAFEIVNHGSVFEVRVNGNDLGEFPYRHPEDHPEHRLDTLHITGDVQLHLVRF